MFLLTWMDCGRIVHSRLALNAETAHSCSGPRNLLIVNIYSLDTTGMHDTVYDRRCAILAVSCRVVPRQHYSIDPMLTLPTLPCIRSLPYMPYLTLYSLSLSPSLCNHCPRLSSVLVSPVPFQLRHQSTASKWL